MAERQIATKYKGSALGWFWTILTPLLMLAVYMFVFSVVFQRRWETAIGDKGNFALFLFSGLICHGFLAELLSRAPGLIAEKRNYVKRIMFPLEVIPIVAVAAAGFTLLVNLAILLLMYVISIGLPPPTILFFPIVLAPLAIFGAGIAYLFSAVGVFMRDLRHASQILVLLFLFLTPIFYPLESVPEAYRSWTLINPLAAIVHELRGILFFARPPALSTMLPLWVGTTAFALVARAFFMRLREVFADAV